VRGFPKKRALPQKEIESFKEIGSNISYWSADDLLRLIIKVFLMAALISGCPETVDEELPVPSPKPNPPVNVFDGGGTEVPTMDAGQTNPPLTDSGIEATPNQDSGSAEVPALDAGLDLPVIDGGEAEVPALDAGLDLPLTDGGETQVPQPDGGVWINVNEDVFNRLSPNCAACHTSGPKDFFKDIDTFEEKLVYNPFYVMPGDAENSELIRLLIGEGTTFSQMPTYGEDFETLSGTGQTQITLEEVEAWINNLEPLNNGVNDAVVLLSPEMHLRRVAIALKGQLPSETEVQQIRIASDPDVLIASFIDDYMNTAEFGETLRELFNEVLRVRTSKEQFFPMQDTLHDEQPPFNGVDGVTVSPWHFEQGALMMNWVNRAAMEEPLKIFEYVVRSDLELRQLVTGNFTLANAVTQAIYGTDSTKCYANGACVEHNGFGNCSSVSETLTDGFEGWEVCQYAEEDRNNTSFEGRAHAGILASNAFYTRYPSAGANYNRGRANAITDALLCYDFLAQGFILETIDVDLADPEAVADAVRTEPACVNCHQNLDPLGSFLFVFRKNPFASEYVDEGYPFPMFSAFFQNYNPTGLAPRYFEQTALPADLLIGADFQVVSSLINNQTTQIDFDSAMNHNTLGLQKGDVAVLWDTVDVETSSGVFRNSDGWYLIEDLASANAQRIRLKARLPGLGPNAKASFYRPQRLKHLGQYISEDPRFYKCMAKHFYGYFHQIQRQDILDQDVVDFISILNDTHSAKTMLKEMLMSPRFKEAYTDDEAIGEDVIGHKKLRSLEIARLYEDLTGFHWESFFDKDTSEPFPFGQFDVIRQPVGGYTTMGGATDALNISQPSHTTNATNMAFWHRYAEAAAGYLVSIDLDVAATSQLFTEVDVGDTDENMIRSQLVRFYDRFYGEVLNANHAEIDAAYGLFETVHSRTQDIPYAWKVVVTALLQDFRLTHY
jgi:hypothetical protein